MRIPLLNEHGAAWAAVAVAVLAAACDRGPAVGPIDRPDVAAPELAVTLEVSGVSQGRAAVALRARAETGEALAGIQGYLRFDPRQLHYLGQELSGNSMALVNARDAERGVLRLLSFNVQEGLPERAAVLAFEAVGNHPEHGLRFELEAAETLTGVAMYRALGSDVLAVSDLAIPASPRLLDVNDWAHYLAPGLLVDARLQYSPGTIMPGLVYGNANLDAGQTVNVLDAFVVANMSVGNFELIIGTSSPNRDGVIAGNVQPFNVGSAQPPGVASDGVSRVINVLDVSAIAREGVGIDQAVVGTVIPGRETTVNNPKPTVTLLGDLTSPRTLFADTLYRISGVVRVRSDVTIQAGTRLEGVDGASALFVMRDGRLFANGTLLQPIRLTCETPEGSKFKGCWGGVVVLGNAPIVEGTGLTTGADDGVAAGRAVAGCNQRIVEGSTTAFFGGCNPDDNSGVYRYIVEEFSGLVIGANNELNGITFAGVGRGTTVDFIQVHGGLDDGIEIFGGNFNLKHLYFTANSDDSFDYSYGWNGKAQFLVIQQDSADGDKLFEVDNTENSATYGDGFASGDGGCTGSPYSCVTRPTIFNVTAVGPRAHGYHLRRGSRSIISNALTVSFTAGIIIDNVETCGGGTNDTPTLNTEFTHSIFANIGSLRDGTWACEITYSNNLELPTDMDGGLPLIRDQHSKLLPDFRATFGTVAATTLGATPPSDGFFDVTATYIGGVQPANLQGSNIPWYSGWVRGWQSATVP